MVCYFALFVHQESGTGQTAASGYQMLTAAAVSSQEQRFFLQKFKKYVSKILLAVTSERSNGA
jgi:hypothetical protein